MVTRGLPLVLLTLATFGAPGDAQQRRSDQRAAFEARQSGRQMSAREIEARIVPRMRGAQYLGFDFDGGSGIYTLKFLRDGSVIWVEVDGRSGEIVGRAGN